MAKQRVQTPARGIVEDAGVALLGGAFVTLLLGSLAASGLNTLLVARILLGGAWASISLLVFVGRPTAHLRQETKILCALLVAAPLVGIGWAETVFQPKRPTLPVPPLELLVSPPPFEPLASGAHKLRVASMGDFPVGVDHLTIPIGGYAGFGENDEDDPVLAIPNVTFANLSNRPVKLTWSVSVTGEGHRLALAGDGRGRWQRQLGVNDFVAANGGHSILWTFPPLDLAPRGQKRGSMVFVAPNVDIATRNAILRGGLGPLYRYELTLRDEISGKSETVALPFVAAPEGGVSATTK